MSTKKTAYLAIISVFVSYFSGLSSFASELPRFSFPLDCTLGQDCWAANYVDMDPKADSAKDFTCGPRSYEAHQGTDFALRSEAEMRAGVKVLAAMAGTVLRVRDGATDSLKTPDELDKIHKDNKDCGNGVYVDHAVAGFKGLTTLYCHMKQGSIRVKSGEAVKAGAVLGQVGQSGYAEFPHLHFGILWEGAAMDPFTGLARADGCGGFKRSLWKDDVKIAYSPAAIYAGGFRGDTPDFAAIKAGELEPKSLSPAGKGLVLWAGLFGVQAGDKIALTILDPNGAEFIRRDIVQDTTRARQFYFAGRTLEGKTVPTGVWSGQITLERTGMPTQTGAFGVRVQ